MPQSSTVLFVLSSAPLGCGYSQWKTPLFHLELLSSLPWCSAVLSGELVNASSSISSSYHKDLNFPQAMFTTTFCALLLEQILQLSFSHHSQHCFLNPLYLLYVSLSVSVIVLHECCHLGPDLLSCANLPGFQICVCVAGSGLFSGIFTKIARFVDERTASSFQSR